MNIRSIFTKTNGYFIVIFFTAAVFGFDYNILHGFFPHIAPTKNVTVIVNGLLYSEYEVVILIVFPLAGKLAPIIGGEKVLFLGALTLGIFSILFGLAYFLPAGFPFILASFGARAVSSVGAAFGYVVNPALIATLGDGEKVCTLIGTLESVLTGGIMIGPTVGSVLFKYGGYICPFAFIGGLMIVLSIIVISTFPNFKSATIIEGKISLFVSSVNFWVNMFALFMINFTVGFQSACFFLYCKEKFQMSPLTSSLAFLGDALAFTAVSPVVGMLNDAHPKLLPNSICFGLFLAALSLCFMGPLPFLLIKPHIGISVVATIVFGIGDAFVFSPVFTQLLTVALDVGLTDDFRTYSIVSSCHGFVGVFALALGPTLGVIMYTHLGYGYSCGIIAIFMVLEIFVIVIVTVISHAFDVEIDGYCRTRCCSLTASGRMHVYNYKPVIDEILNPNIKTNMDTSNKLGTKEDKLGLLTEEEDSKSQEEEESR